MKGNSWDDHYARRARHEKWLARSVYKLEEIDQKFRLIQKGDRLLDLGCYPGSWSQYGIKKIGSTGKVTGIDISRPNKLSFPNFEFIRADIFLLDAAQLAEKIGPTSLVMSDLAPKTTGVKMVDVSRSMDLARRALEVAVLVLKKKGHFLCKVFEGEDLKSFRSEAFQHFGRVALFRSKAVRKGSKEIYLVGKGLKKD